MSWLRRFSRLGLPLLLTAGVGCTSSDTLTEPAAAVSSEQSSPSFGLIDDLTGDLTGTLVGTLGKVTDLLTCSPQKYVLKAATIGPLGGTIKVGDHFLEIPQGALNRTVEITAEQIPGSSNSVRFSPEGLKFNESAQLTMSYDNCLLVLIQKKIVYTDENLKVREVLRSLDLLGKKDVTAPIDHFSRYAVAY